MIQKIDNGLYLFREAHEEGCNVYMLEADGECLFIDTGLFSDELVDYSEKGKAIVTHYHFDHVGNNCLFDNVLMHPLTEELILKGELKQSLIPDSFDVKRAIPRNGNRAKYLTNDQIIQHGDFKLQVLFTPGHSPDSICLYEPKRKWLFTGDTFCPNSRYILKDSNVDDWKISLDLLSKLDTDLVLVGHDDVIEKLPADIGSFAYTDNVVKIDL